MKMAEYLGLFLFMLIVVDKVYSSPECLDMVSITLEKNVTHGTVKTADEIVRNAIIMEDSMINSNVYYAYKSPICKHGDIYRYNCLGLKTLSSYEEFKVMSNKFCWPNDIHINADCMLPTIRIINGSLFCELEYTRYGVNKPTIAKIDIQSGNISQVIELKDAKHTSNCLQTRTPSWKSECSGKINDFNVHVMVDETGLWIAYPSPISSIYLIKQISIHDMSTLSSLEIPAILHYQRAMVVCRKFYVMSVNGTLIITKAFDLNDKRNYFDFPVDISGKLPVSESSWIQYNPRLQKLYLGNPDSDETIIFHVNKCLKTFPNDFDLLRLNSSFLWALEPSGNNHIRAMVNNLAMYFKITDAKELDKISGQLLSCPTFICNKIPNPKQLYCRVKAEITSLKIYSDFRKITNDKTKRLQVQFRIEKILEQQQFKTLSTKLHSFQTFMTLNFNDLKTQINSFREEMGHYFTNLAAFDRKKANVDIDSIYNDIDKYNNEFNRNFDNLAKNIRSILIGAFSVTTADVVSFAARVALASTSMFNPFTHIAEGAGALLKLMEAIDNLALSAAKFPKLIRLVTTLNTMKKQAIQIKDKLSENQIKHTYIRKLVLAARNKTLNNTEISQYMDAFLVEYAEFDSGFDVSLTTEFGSTLTVIIDEGCNILFDGQTAQSAIVMAGFSSAGQCLKSKVDVQILTAVLDKTVDLQTELLDSLASFVRSKTAENSALSISAIENRITEAERDGDLLELQVYSLQLFISSEVHRIIIIQDACNIIQYINGGLLPEYCVKAIENPFSQQSDDIIAYRFDRDMCSDSIDSILDIPVVYNSSQSETLSGTIDLTSLYNEKEVTFKIPNRDWLIQNDWVLAEDANSMIVVKRFEPYLHLPLSLTTLVNIRVSTRMVGQNVITPSGTEYTFDTRYEYNFRYSINEQSCETYINDPYQPKGTRPSICLKSRGDMRGSLIHPSVYAQWTLKATMSDSFQFSVIPKDTKLKVGVTICISRSSGSQDGRHSMVSTISTGSAKNTTISTGSAKTRISVLDPLKTAKYVLFYTVFYCVIICLYNRKWN